MICADRPLTLPVEEVCRRCREETAKYRQRKDHDDRFCFELIRRAIEERDDACWEALHAIYGEQLLAWCRKAVGNLAIEPDELVSLAWEKFLFSFTPPKLRQANGTKGVLAYLKMCARSVAIDQVRGQCPTVPFDDALGERDPHLSPADIHAEIAGREAFWAIVDSLLNSVREREFMRMFYELELKSAEIQQRAPDLFPTVQDVYSVRRNVHDRLGRSPKLRAWLAEQD